MGYAGAFSFYSGLQLTIFTDALLGNQSQAREMGRSIP